MDTLVFIFFGIFGIFGILFLIFMLYSAYVIERDLEDKAIQNIKEKESFDNQKCACVFDLDDTITCSVDRAAKVIQKCRDNGCLIAFNTARTIPYYQDLDLRSLGIINKDLENFYIGDHYNLGYSLSEEGLHNHIADTKVKHLQTIKDRHSIGNSHRIILFDDNLKNITWARSNGFSAIHANSPSCGLNMGSVEEVERMLST